MMLMKETNGKIAVQREAKGCSGLLTAAGASNLWIMQKGHGTMEHARIEGRAESIRIPTSVKARYFLKNRQLPGRECTVINISLNGAGLAFYAHETMEQGSKLSLKMYALGGKATITVDGVVSWVKQGKKDFLCGIKLMDVLDNAEQMVLGLY